MVRAQDVVSKRGQDKRKEMFKKRIKLCELVQNMWRLFPIGVLEIGEKSTMDDNTKNYGSHMITLGFDKMDPLEYKHKIGSKTMGLRYENEHSVVHWNSTMCNLSQKNLEFLLNVYDSILIQFPTEKKSLQEYLRVNLIVGAKTIEHTDNMRGATPSFIMIEPGKSFVLRIRLFPSFKTSVVKYQGKRYIPHQLHHDSLVMIGEDDNGDPRYFKFRSKETIEELEPYGDFSDYIVVGIKAKKLQVIPREYAVFENTRDLELIDMSTILEASETKRVYEVKKKFRYIQHGVGRNKLRWHKFFGWMHAHMWMDWSDSMAKRIHVFFRAIREETICARLKTRKETQEPINYTVIS